MNRKTMVSLLAAVMMLGGCGTKENKPAADTPQETPVSTPETAPQETSDNPFLHTVWTAKRKDLMFEFRLEFSGEKRYYVMRMLDGKIDAILRGTYEVTEEGADIYGTDLVSDMTYEPSASMISAKMADSKLPLTFRLSDEKARDEKEMESMFSGDDASDLIIEGWPSDVPKPEIGGELKNKDNGKNSITLNFSGIDPQKAEQYVKTLQEAGFQITDDTQKEVGNNLGNKDGGPVYSRHVELVKGEIKEYGELSRLETGWALEITYGMDDYYDKASGQLVQHPSARITLYFGADQQ